MKNSLAWYIFLFIGITTFAFDYFSTKPKTQSDLIVINATIEKFNYKPDNNQKYTYLIKCNNLPNNCMIPAGYLSIFDRNSFEINAKKGYIFQLKFSKNQLKKSDSTEIFLLYGIASNHQIFLNSDSCLKINTSKISYLFSILFVLVGILFLFLKKNRIFFSQI